MQCSQETADYNDHQVGNMRAMLPAKYATRTYSDSLTVIENRKRLKSNRLPVYPLSTLIQIIIADYLKNQSIPMLLQAGAVLWMELFIYNPPKQDTDYTHILMKCVKLCIPLVKV